MGTPSGLSHIFLELTSRCDKKTLCSICAHQSPKFNPTLELGDMDFALLAKIREQLEPGVTVSFHHDGDPLTFPRLDDALRLFQGFVTSLVTHGESLGKRAEAIIGNAATVTVSIVRNDPDWGMQLESIRRFLQLKGKALPVLNLKFVGDIEPHRTAIYEDLGVPILRRLVHVPDGNYRYVRGVPNRPEHNICLDFLHCPSVDWRGRLFVCNRFRRGDKGLLGDLNESSLDELWNSPLRQKWLKAHVAGRRDLASPLCVSCLYYGVPTEGL